MNNRKIHHLWLDAGERSSLYNSTKYLEQVGDFLYHVKDPIDFSNRLFDAIELMDKKKVPKKDVAKNKHFVFHLLNWGAKLMQSFPKDSDLFYLGAFLEVKLPEMWTKFSFFKMMKKLFKKVCSGVIKFSKKVKEKIAFQYYLKYPDSYQDLFKAPIAC